MIDDNIVGIGEGVGEGVDEGVGEGVDEGVGEGTGEGAGEGVGEDIGGAIGENVGQVAEEAVDEDIGENIGEAFGEDVGQVAKEPVDESDAMLSEDSFRSLKTDDSDLEDNMDHVEAFSYDVNNPITEVGAKYPNVASFRDALTHFALLNEFEYNLQKSDLLRVTATYAKSNCKWRIHSSRLQDSLVFQIKTLQGEHTCTSANRCRNKVATQSWVCNRVIEWLRLEGDLSTTELRKRLQQKYHVDLTYSKIFRGKEMALSKIHGHWEYSYQRIYNFKEEIVRRNPGSHVEVKLQVINEEHYFQRVFLAFGPCIQGFLNGCRPYIALDGCHLKGKHRGVLISATSIDGNKSIFPIAFGVVESKNSNSWEWFLHGLKTAIGESEGLVFSSDRQKGLDEAVQVVYPRVEHRECMRHLYDNFKKKFRGDCYRDNLWAAAKAYIPNVYETSIAKVYEANPMAIEYLRQNHSYLWSRSKFGTIAKCDYLTNNISESFNAWISNDRHRPLIDMLDTIRQKIMVKMEDRRNRAKK
ncbi:uncharacterized protein LOC109715442 [Ananas comosus]|uniref:Uncharacterized protein LOC109715442 n=1 Tax=Ananas comosus TaxID=4615 RepID=A0A6P5FK61_ANACO|nr:uncharacterized protein LOC109715442 [Ananas comosus]